MTPKDSLHLADVAKVLKRILDELFAKTTLNYTKDPQIRERNIVEYESKMRVDGLEKFNAPCYGSAINLFLSEDARENEDAMGALIIYLDLSDAEKIFKALGTEDFDDENEEEMLKICGSNLQSIGNQFSSGLENLGYHNLILSNPIHFRNSIHEGLAFSYDEYQYCQLDFYFWKHKSFVVDITISPPP